MRKIDGLMGRCLENHQPQSFILFLLLVITSFCAMNACRTRGEEAPGATGYGVKVPKDSGRLGRQQKEQPGNLSFRAATRLCSETQSRFNPF